MKRRTVLQSVGVAIGLLFIKPWQIFGEPDDKLQGKTMVIYYNAFREEEREPQYHPNAILVRRSKTLPGNRIQVWISDVDHFDIGTKSAIWPRQAVITEDEEICLIISVDKSTIFQHSFIMQKVHGKV